MNPSRSEKSSNTIPLLLEYTSEYRERARQEELYNPPTRLWRWCIAPVIFLATMIPASVLLIRILQAQNQQAGVMHHGITLIPTLSVGVDIMGIGVVLVSIMGLIGVAKGCSRLMHWYFGLVLCFVGVQVGYAIIGFMSGSGWIQEALEKSWDKAYESDKSLIRDLQIEFNCQGFYTQDDRAVYSPSGPTGYIPACGEILQARFGQRLQRLGSLILCIRLIQLTGVFLLSILFKHLAVMDQNDEDEDKVDEESPYFKSEKQIEDENSRVPLLSGEDEEDLPHYSAEDVYGQEYQDSDATEAEDDEDDEDGDDERQLCADRFSDSEYPYRDLPSMCPRYAEEDECETRVYVA